MHFVFRRHCWMAAIMAAILFAVVLLASQMPKAGAADVAAPVQGENFANQPSGTVVVNDSTLYSGGQALKFTANVTASTPVNCSATCDVTLMARGGQSGASPTFSVNGAPAQTITNSGAPQAYTFDVNLPAGSNTVSVTAGNTGTGHNAFLDVATFPASGGGTVAACADGLDNDGDGLVDLNDPGCSSSTDNDETNAVSSGARLVGAGDIAESGSTDDATANLIKNRPAASVYTAGDNAYPNGSTSDYANKYDPSWGAFKNRTYPSPGNHDYGTSGAAGYKSYFGSGVPSAVKVNPTYYAYTLGNWRLYALDSNIAADSASAQYKWLQSDLASDNHPCELAYWHHPVASSGEHGSLSKMRAIFSLLDAQGADLVLNGHDHDYERFPRINSTGGASSNGVVEIVIGTGGAGLRNFTKSPLPTTIVRNGVTHGIGDIDLNASGWSGKFVPSDGSFTDSFSGSCQ